MGKDLKGKDLGKGLSQRTDGRYEARAIVKGIKIDLYDSDLKRLKVLFEQAKTDVMNGMEIKYKNITLNAWFEEWFEKYKKPALKETSIYPTKNRFYKVFGSIGKMQMSMIKNIHIQECVNKVIESGMAVSSVRSSISTLRDCFMSAANNGVISTNPAHDIVVPWQETKKVLRRSLDKEERKLFLEAVEHTYYEEMYHVMLLTGMRIGEVGGLCWSDVDFKNKQITINRALSCQYRNGIKSQKLVDPKTSNSFRTIPFIQDIEVWLKRWKDKQAGFRKELGDRWKSRNNIGDLVFTTSLGSPITRYIVEKDINQIVAKINAQQAFVGGRQIEPIYPHALRHTFCTICFESGMNPKVVQNLMGHANYSTTIDIYTHVTGQTIQDEIGKFNLTQDSKTDAN